ncbi:hypothetical protein [Duganella sp. HH101]|uniref:hypothetical protein n=1 Tax=Duganella sp. HH101 TaxID=1781066 RepID=UPI00087363B9|nr:hypothetical protein [Duganella sp. HH101]OFA05648.1 hypothetical protein DUGA2_12270 [Duganella sp. HH101]
MNCQSTSTPDISTNVIASIPGIANNLTIEQTNFLDALWNFFSETGSSFPKRNLLGILGKRSFNDVIAGMASGLIVEQFESGEKRYSLTLRGALSSSKGVALVELFIRLLDLVKALHEEDSEVRQIDSVLIGRRLFLSSDEAARLAAIMRITSLPGVPFYFSGQLEDRSRWFLTITEDVVDLFNASNSREFLFEKLRMTAMLIEPHHAWSSVFSGQPMELLWKGVDASGSAQDRRDGDFVAVERLDALRKIEHAEFDCTRLVCLCEELNVCAEARCAHAVILLTRAILDHIPPVFGLNTFAEVASNYGGKSFKASADRLEKHARKVADRMLHQMIRDREVAPEMKEVAYPQELETVLSEVCRILKTNVLASK